MQDDVGVSFDVLTPLGFRVRVTQERWELITTVKHPVIAGRESSVGLALESPDEARQSRTDPEVLLFYKAEGPKHWVCAVTKQTDNQGFLITAYPTVDVACSRARRERPAPGIQLNTRRADENDGRTCGATSP